MSNVIAERIKLVDEGTVLADESVPLGTADRIEYLWLDGQRYKVRSRDWDLNDRCIVLTLDYLPGFVYPITGETS